MSVEESQKASKHAMSALEQIETGSFATPGWVIFPPDSLRVVSWNINRGSHLDRVIEFLTRVKADILLLQEADQNARRTHHINVAREIAQKLRMNYAFWEAISGTDAGLADVSGLSRSSNAVPLAFVQLPNHPLQGADELLEAALVPSGNSTVARASRWSAR